jgi:hypothetical protein
MAGGPAAEQSSLEELERDFWGDPPADATRLIATVHELRHRPLAELGPEDLRVLIAQRVGLDVLVPRALDLLEADPLVEGDFYPGDLLAAVLRVPADYWAAHSGQLARARRIASSVDLSEVDGETRSDIEAFLRA